MTLGKTQRATYGRSACRTVARVAACGVAGVLRAADFTWSVAPASASWNETDENWTGAASVWTSSSTNSATFGASAATSITADPLTLSNLTFGAGGYTLGGGRLTMHGAPSVTAGVSAVLSATITNIGVWAKGGGGTLTVDPGAGNTNVFFALKAATGVVEIVSGTNLVVQFGSNPESGPAFWVTGGKLVVGGGIVKTLGNMYARVSEYGTLLVTNGVVDLTTMSELLNGHNTPGVVTVSDGGVLDVQQLRISQNFSAANLTAVNINTGGVIRLNRFNLDASSAKNGTVNFNGGTVVAKNSAAQEDLLGTTSTNWRNIVANVLPGGAVINNNGCNITLRQNLKGSPNDGGLTKVNSGYLYVRGTNSYSGATVLKGGALNIIRDHNLGSAPAAPATNVLFLASSTLQSSESHALAATRTIWITNAVTATFDTQAHTQTVYGAIVCAETNSTVVKGGAGTLVLDPGPSAVNVFGTLQTTAGTLVVASGTNLVTAPNKGQNAPGLRVSGGTMLVAGGVVKTTNLMFVNVDGGHLLVTNGLVDTTSCYEVLNGIGSTYGFTTVSGSGTLLANAIRISQNTGNPSNMVVSVNTGGVLRVNNFYIDVNFSGQKGMVFLNGGTVEARMDNVNFLGTTESLVGNSNDKWLTNIFVHVCEGGAIFNTAGKAISIKQPLYAGAPSDGGLTKRGAGTLTLLNTNTYTGATSVEGGTLVFGRDSLLPASSEVWVSSNAVLNANGKAQTLAALGGSGTVTNPSALAVSGLVSPGDADSFGTLTLAAAPAALSGALSISVSTNGACDRLHVSGGLDLSPLTLNVENPEQLSKFMRYTVATCDGALSAPFASVGVLPARWLVRYNAASAYLVYDFGNLISVR